MSTSPTQRSLKHLRDNGWRAEVTERWNAFARVRQDLFGFVDILAVHPDRKPLMVQTTSYSNVSARVEKIKASEYLTSVDRWFDIVVHGWKKNKEGKWEVRVVEIN